MRLFKRDQVALLSLSLILALALLFAGCSGGGSGGESAKDYKVTVHRTISVNESVPAASGVSAVADDGGVTVTDEGEAGEVIFEVTEARGAGEPITVTYTFDTYATPAEMELFNGGEGEDTGDRISSAHVVLNGEEIFGPSDFNQDVDELESDITLLDGENVLEITLNSTPGAKVTIVIEQEIDVELEGGDGDGVE